LVVKKRELNDWLKILSVLAIVIIFLRQFVLYNVPEFVPFGEELGELLYDSCVGYLITFWFYYLTVYLRDQNYKKRVYEFVARRAKEIVRDFNDLLQDLETFKNNQHQVKNIDLDSEYNLGLILKLIDPSSASLRLNGAFQSITWGEFFKLKRNMIENALKDIFLFVPYLEEEDIQLFTNIYSSQFLALIKNIDLNKVQDLHFLSKVMWKFNDDYIKVLDNKFCKKERQIYKYC
jgi:hypothetical protein